MKDIISRLMSLNNMENPSTTLQSLENKGFQINTFKNDESGYNINAFRKAQNSEEEFESMLKKGPYSFQKTQRYFKSNRF